MQIGIMSVVHEGRFPFGKQTYFFEDMVRSVPEMEEVLFFFSPLDWNEDDESISGYRFVNGEWISSTSVIPGIIYDRSFSSNESQKIKIEYCRQYLEASEKTILNPFGLAELLNDKIAFHLFMLDHDIPTLKTFPFSNILEESFLDTFNTRRVYLKPSFGSKGEGIYVVEKKGDNYILFDNLGNPTIFEVHSKLIDELETLISDAERYFIQEEAQIELFDTSPFDIRVLVQNYGNDYQVTGKAVRVGQDGSITSNLNSGGSALPIEEMGDFFKQRYDYNLDQLISEIEKLCLDCSHVLKAEIGEFCEIGFDILITKDNGPIIIEGNAKPSRWVFVKIADYLLNQGKDNSYYLDCRNETVSVPMRYASTLL